MPSSFLSVSIIRFNCNRYFLKYIKYFRKQKIIRNYRNGNIPEIGSTIYSTIPTGGNTTFIKASSEETKTERQLCETCLMRKRSSRMKGSKSYNLSSRYVYHPKRSLVSFEKVKF